MKQYFVLVGVTMINYFSIIVFYLCYSVKEQTPALKFVQITMIVMHAISLILMRGDDDENNNSKDDDMSDM